MVVAGCGGGAHGHWADPGARLVDGMWIGPQIVCPPARDGCASISSGAQVGVSDTEPSQVVQIPWVSLPTHFVTDEGEPRSPARGVGIVTSPPCRRRWIANATAWSGWVANLLHTSDGPVAGSAAKCTPVPLSDWQDGAVHPRSRGGRTDGERQSPRALMAYGRPM